MADPLRSRLSRRTLLASLAAGTVALGSGCAAGQGSVHSVDPQEFVNELAIPPLAKSTMIDGVRVFTLTAGEGTATFRPGVTTPTWGFNGDHLGPTLRAERGERVAVEIINGLGVATSVHWHGMHLPAVMDGGPHQEIAAGGTWRPTWQIDQSAATLWYHPHQHGTTEEHVYRGLAGLFILDDDASAEADLPREYGVDDLPLILQDKMISADGELTLKDDGGEPGTLGNLVMINGTVGAYHEVSTERVRLRLLNGSTARTYELGFETLEPELIATDGGLLEAPLRISRVRLSPGERAELVITLKPGATVRLRSFEVDLGDVAAPFAMGGNDAFDVLELRAAKTLRSSPKPRWGRSRHADQDALDQAAATVTRVFELEERTINGRKMDMGRIDEVITVGTTEIWEVRNTIPMPHSLHVHDVQFRVLTIDGQAPPPSQQGPKDTVYLEPNRTYRLLLRFDDYTDPTMPYMFHCHMLLHEDEGMMGQFVVIKPGDEGRVAAPGHGDHQGGGGEAGGHDHHGHGA
jgi:FtsP/CotA-like multicopper oxidase with cupredoxin domain